MSNPCNIEAFGAGGELRMIVETPRGSAVKLKYDLKLKISPYPNRCRSDLPTHSTGASFRAPKERMVILSTLLPFTTRPLIPA